ncbi:MAG: DNA polymerase III subunit delta [Treponema sp.]|jgi:DNA polymerase-3 subunit delta|nr:DNA polymerase III subunit delta [Treponema sp.]
MAKGSCFLFLGPEIGEKQDAIAEIRSRLCKQSGRAYVEETSFYAGETPVSTMVSVLQNASLFADTRLILIKSAEVLKKKEEIELLGAYLAHPQDDTTLILISEAVSLAKALETPVPSGNKRIFWELFENRKIDWVRSFFKRPGYQINEDGIERILEMVENNTEALRQECSRLMLFLGKDRTITGEDVEKWLSHTREESAFTLFSRIAEGDLAKSLTTLHTLLMAKESPPAILAGLVWCFRKLRDYDALVESGEADDLEFKKIGLGSSKSRKDYEQASRRYNARAADACLALTAEFDILVRSSGTGLETILMDFYLYKIHQVR